MSENLKYGVDYTYFVSTRHIVVDGIDYLLKKENGTLSACVDHTYDSQVFIEIPSKVTCQFDKQVYSVNEIKKRAFSKKKIEKVALPDSITIIEEGAFEYCDKLKDIKISRNLTKIPRRCFIGCCSLKRITLPEGIKAIEDEAFSSCYNLEEIYFPISLESIGYRAFSSTHLFSIDIRGKVDIHPFAFTHCSNLKAISIHDKEAKLGIESFSHCEVLEMVQIPRDLIIYDYSFMGCKKLPKSIKKSLIKTTEGKRLREKENKRKYGSKYPLVGILAYGSAFIGYSILVLLGLAIVALLFIARGAIITCLMIVFLVVLLSVVSIVGILVPPAIVYLGYHCYSNVKSTFLKWVLNIVTLAIAVALMFPIVHFAIKYWSALISDIKAFIS